MSGVCRSRTTRRSRQRAAARARARESEACRASRTGGAGDRHLGQLELDYAARSARRRGGAGPRLARRAHRLRRDRSLEGMASVSTLPEGWKVEVAADMRANDYLDGLDETRPARGRGRLAAATRPRGSPRRSSSARRLHLSNRLNKTETERGARYGAHEGLALQRLDARRKSSRSTRSARWTRSPTADGSLSVEEALEYMRRRASRSPA